jgi:serine O-acetyltransferase
LTIRLRCSLRIDGLCRLAAHQANALFPDGDPMSPADLVAAARTALARVEHCFSHVANRYFFDGNGPCFDHLHGDQYAMWLYVLARELHLAGGPDPACRKLFLLNKAMHGCDIFYEVELPTVFLLVHPLGTVLGRGSYGERFIAYQRCGVGSNHGTYPVIGSGVTMHPGSSILGRSRIGDGCTIAADALVLDRDLSDNSLYIGSPRDCVVSSRAPDHRPWRTPG